MTCSLTWSRTWNKPWLPRAGVVAGALVYAALAIGNGLDRIAIVRPDIARYVPAMFASNALEVVAEANLQGSSDTDAGVAEKLVARAPVEPFSTALLGASRYDMDDAAGADRAFRVAGQLGWRNPLTQSYWLEKALVVGDTKVAAQRLDALLRQRPGLLQLPELLASFESDAAGQNALADRLATRPPWLTWYAGSVDPAPDAAALARRVPSLMLLADRGIVLGCPVIAPAVAELAAAGLTGDAAALRRRHCPANTG